MSDQESNSQTPSDDRNGNWMDEFGSCKLCDGEIPHGHAGNCHILKLETELNEANARLALLNPMIFKGIGTALKDRDQWKWCAESLNAYAAHGPTCGSTFSNKCDCGAFKAMSLFQELSKQK